MANDDLKQHIAAFLRDYSIEVTPHDAEKLDAIARSCSPAPRVRRAPARRADRRHRDARRGECRS